MRAVGAQLPVQVTSDAMKSIHILPNLVVNSWRNRILGKDSVQHSKVSLHSYIRCHHRRSPTGCKG